MAELSQNTVPGSLPTSGMTPAWVRNGLRKRLENAKREAIESQLGKGESWCTKLLNGHSGVMIDDIELLAGALGLKLVDKSKHCVDPALAHAYEAIVRKATAERSLLFEDSE